MVINISKTNKMRPLQGTVLVLPDNWVQDAVGIFLSLSAEIKVTGY